MKYKTTHIQQKERGFALLIAILVIGIVLAVGLSLLNISLREINLTTTARDSELAFAAANAGLECGEYSRFHVDNERYTDGDQSNDGTAGLTFRCIAGTTQSSVKAVDKNAHGQIYFFNKSFTLNNVSDGGRSCTDVDVWIMDASKRTTPWKNTFGGIYGDYSRTCPAGSICTNIFARGFNLACNDVGSKRTVQREMTAEF